MTTYNVHLYREMRLLFEGIEAESHEAAAAIARDKPTDDADDIEDCNGEDLGALVDVVGDDQYEHSRTIDFEAERQRQAATKLLAALIYALEFLRANDDGEPDVRSRISAGEAAVAEAKTAGILSAPREPDIHAILAARREIAVTWAVADVRSLRDDLTDEQAWEVLQQVKDIHDAEWGISWTTLQVVADDLFPRRKPAEEA